MRQHYIATRIAAIKKAISSVGGNAEKLESLCTADGQVKW